MSDSSTVHSTRNMQSTDAVPRAVKTGQSDDDAADSTAEEKYRASSTTYAHSRPDPTAGSPADHSGAPNRTGRWWNGVGAGLVVSLPLAWLLSYAALLMFFLGLFFFSLFGLIIGATVFRIASPGRPFAGGHVLAGTALLILVPWGISLVKEGRDFPYDVGTRTVRERSLDLHGKTVDDYRAMVAKDVRSFLATEYPPGGTIGYMRWVCTDGTITKTQVGSLVRDWRHGQSGAIWMVRVLLSLVLLTFGIASQTMPLRLPAKL